MKLIEGALDISWQGSTCRRVGTSMAFNQPSLSAWVVKYSSLLDLELVSTEEYCMHLTVELKASARENPPWCHNSGSSPPQKAKARSIPLGIGWGLITDRHYTRRGNKTTEIQTG